MSDMQPFADSEWPESIADMRAGFAGRLNVYRVMAHQPDLLRAWAPLRQHVVLGGMLTETEKEIVILRTGYHWGSAYERAHHVVRGRLAGLSDARIARTGMEQQDWGSAQAAGDENDDLLLMRATDAMLQAGCLPKAERVALGAAGYNNAALLDIIATIGLYSTLALIVNSFATPIDPDVVAAGGLQL